MELVFHRAELSAAVSELQLLVFGISAYPWICISRVIVCFGIILRRVSYSNGLLVSSSAATPAAGMVPTSTSPSARLWNTQVRCRDVLCPHVTHILAGQNELLKAFWLSSWFKPLTVTARSTQMLLNPVKKQLSGFSLLIRTGRRLLYIRNVIL